MPPAHLVPRIQLCWSHHQGRHPKDDVWGVILDANASSRFVRQLAASCGLIN